MLAIDESKLGEMVANLEADLKHIPPAALQQAAEILRFSFEQNFLERGRWNGDNPITPMSGGGQRWKPLAESTKSTYAAFGKSTERTLQRTSRLASSIQVFVGADNSLLITTNSKQAAAQQFGVTNTVRVTPQSRKYFWAMYFKTKLEMYKGLALTKKETLTMTIPPSPFIVIQGQDLIDIAEEIALSRGGGI